MAAIHDLIAQIGEARLRERITAEWTKATRDRKFGLVFEDHLPELLPLPKARPRKGDLVCQRAGSLKDLWRVQGFAGGQVQCRRPQPPAEGQPAETGEFDLAELMVVREFGEPIFPALVPVDAVANGGSAAPWHTLIEADNFHALQLLEYLYAGQVDCIYIDPPYNTGARDWKYNNDFVDGKDTWRHSKWLAFMRRRLELARNLLNPSTGVLVVTIDEHEIHHLGMLMESIWPDAPRQVVTIVINQKGVSQGRFARTEEYALFVFMPNAYLPTHHDDLLSPDRGDLKRFQVPRWEWLLRGGTNSRRGDRPLLFYPIFVDPESRKIIDVGEPLPLSQTPETVTGDMRIAWPIRSDGSHGNWQVGPTSFRELIQRGFVRLGGFDSRRNTWTVQYLNRGTRLRIERGEIVIVGRDTETGSVEIEYANVDSRLRNIKTVWHRGTHDSGVYGSSLLKSVLGTAGAFAFPKSLYSTRDAISAITRATPDALVVDFFAGSGTTLNAVNVLNAADGGNRRCILVTNNEVSASEVDALSNRGLQPGDDEWEAQGICRSVTWPRSKFTILGRRDDGSPLPGDYLTGRTRQINKPRRFTQIGFVEPAQLDTVDKRKQVVALIDGLPQTAVSEGTNFVVSEDHAASVLFDPASAESWLEALKSQDHIARFYIVTPVKRLYDQIKAAVTDLLGPLQVSEDDTRPMRDGFPANLAYFRLDFLDPERVSLKRAFREVLPLLWLKAGAVGPRPALPPGEPEPALFEPEGCQFVVLLQESRLKRLLSAVQHRTAPLSHVFIVTDSDESFKRMATEVQAVVGANAATLQVLQLYRDYLTNFLINRHQEGGDSPEGAAP
jgi:adenine-specific DNA-methyltransferase